MGPDRRTSAPAPTEDPAGYAQTSLECLRPEIVRRILEHLDTASLTQLSSLSPGTARHCLSYLAGLRELHGLACNIRKAELIALLAHVRDNSLQLLDVTNVFSTKTGRVILTPSEVAEIVQHHTDSLQYVAVDDINNQLGSALASCPALDSLLVSGRSVSRGSLLDLLRVLGVRSLELPNMVLFDHAFIKPFVVVVGGSRLHQTLRSLDICVALDSTDAAHDTYSITDALQALPALEGLRLHVTDNAHTGLDTGQTQHPLLYIKHRALRSITIKSDTPIFVLTATASLERLRCNRHCCINRRHLSEILNFYPALSSLCVHFGGALDSWRLRMYSQFTLEEVSLTAAPAANPEAKRLLQEFRGMDTYSRPLPAPPTPPAAQHTPHTQHRHPAVRTSVLSLLAHSAPYLRRVRVANVEGSVQGPLACLLSCSHDVEEVTIAVRDGAGANVLRHELHPDDGDTAFDTVYRAYNPVAPAPAPAPEHTGCRCLARFSDLTLPLNVAHLRVLRLLGADVDDALLRTLALTGAAPTLCDLTLVRCPNISTQAVGLLVAGRDLSRLLALCRQSHSQSQSQKRQPGGILEVLAADRDETVLPGESDLRRVVIFGCEAIGAEVTVPLLLCPSCHLHTVGLGLAESLEASLAAALVRRHRLTRLHISPDEEGLESLFQDDPALLFSNESV